MTGLKKDPVACDDTQIEAHKVISSAHYSIRSYMTMLRKNIPNSSPWPILRISPTKLYRCFSTPLKHKKNLGWGIPRITLRTYLMREPRALYTVPLSYRSQQKLGPRGKDLKFFGGFLIFLVAYELDVIIGTRKVDLAWGTMF